MIMKKAIPPECINLVRQKFYVLIIFQNPGPPKVFQLPRLGQQYEHESLLKAPWFYVMHEHILN